MTRVYTKKAIWKRIYQDLKENGFSLVKIKEKIGTQFQRQLYQGYGMNRESFKKLQQLVSYSIPTIQNPFWNESVNLEKIEELAEMVGIILGDGSIDRKVVLISIHSKAKKYIEKVCSLIKSVLNYDPKLQKRKNRDIVEVKIHSVGIVESLMEMGLQIGGKVKNQVGIPNWIKENDCLFTACLRGLIDTDGYIGKYKKRNNSYVWFQYHIGFSNYSKSLIEGFAEFCDRFDIPYSRTHQRILIGSKKGVYKILNLTKPFKLANANFDIKELQNAVK